MDPMEMMTDMSPEQMMGMMHGVMPKMMESCFAKMSAEERASELSMCRSGLDDLEKLGG